MRLYASFLYLNSAVEIKGKVNFTLHPVDHAQRFLSNKETLVWLGDKATVIHHFPFKLGCTPIMRLSR